MTPPPGPTQAEAGAGRTIVVGVDGSAESRAAVAWVAAEARPGVDVVHVVHAAAMRAGRTHVVTAVLALRRTNPGLAVEASLVVGAVVEVLGDFTRVADLVVVGAVSRSAWSARDGGGRVGREIAVRAHCPLVVVPEGGNASSDLPVGILVPEPDMPDAALRCAFAMAAARRQALLVTCVWALGTAWHPEERSEIGTWQIERQQLAYWREEFPAVPVMVQLRRESPLLAAQELHQRAQLLVVPVPQGDGVPLSDSGLAALIRPVVPVMLVPSTQASIGRLAVPTAAGTQPVGL
jgi:universal stress protein family protein